MNRFIVYKTIIHDTDEFYVGVHSRMNPKYIGSGGIKFKNAIRQAQKNNFKITRETLYEYNNEEDMLLKEKEIVNEDLLKDPLCLNSIVGGGDFYHKGMAAYKDLNGKTHFCRTNDDMVLNGDIIPINSNYGVYKDKTTGEIIRCAINDNRVLAGDLVGHTTGIGIYKDKTTGEIIRCFINDKRILSGEIISINSKKIPVKVNDKILMLDLNHPDVKSGKLKHHIAGKKYIRNSNTKEHKPVDVEELDNYIKDGWELGRYYPSRKGYIYINNGLISKNINPTELKTYQKLGWDKGKLC